MGSENVPLVGYQIDHNFYASQETSTESIGTGGVSRKVLYGMTIVSAVVACGCSIYGSFVTKSALIMLLFLIVLLWSLIHYVLLFFERREKHDFHPPRWFIFVSSGHVVIQSLVVMMLTLLKD